MSKLLSLSLVLSLTAALTACGGAAPHSASPRPPFAPGQEWSVISTQPTTMKVIIGRVEPWNGQIAVHVAVTDLVVPAGALNSGRTITIGHMPFEQSALAASVDQLLATGVPLPATFQEGYRNWQDAKGGIYTVSVAKAVASGLEMMKGHRENRADQSR